MNRTVETPQFKVVEIGDKAICYDKLAGNIHIYPIEETNRKLNSIADKLETLIEFLEIKE